MEDRFNRLMADALGQLGEDDEVVEAIKQGIDFAEMTKDAIREDPKVRQAVYDFIRKVIEEMDADDNEDIYEHICDAIFSDDDDVLEGILKSEEMTESIRAKVVSLATEIIDNLDEDDEWLTDIIHDLLDEHLEDREDDGVVVVTLAGAFRPEGELMQKVRERIMKVANKHISKMDNGEGDWEWLIEKIEEMLPIDDSLAEIFQEPDFRQKLNAKVAECALGYIELIEDDSEIVSAHIAGSSRLVDLIKSAAEQVTLPGPSNEMVKMIKRKVDDGDIDLTELVSEALKKEVARRFAQGLVKDSFGGRSTF